MVTIRSVNEIISNLRDFLKLVQPNLDTKPGTINRDLFIDLPANQISVLYDELSQIVDLQSFRLVSGRDLDKLAKNFGITRRTATPSSGTAILTFASIPTTIRINSGDLVYANNGLGFRVQSGTSISPSAINFYRSIATKYRNDLDFVGITDQYAVEVTVQATSSGTASNIGKYALDSSSILGVNNVTNIAAFLGGQDLESDSSFRDRILSVFSGSSVGTALGYTNIAISTTGVSDAIVIEPNDPLMVRDGTVTRRNNDGSLTIVSEGQGGKVDVVILGQSLIENTDSFIYRDRSNTNDPTNSKNDFVLGQIVGDENKTIARRRIDNINNNILPAQPVSEVISVTGSLSGANFTAKTVDSFGRVFGNYELVKDTGSYGGSPWGFDKFAWVSDRVSLFEEDKIKGQFNGQDGASFTDVLEVPRVQQNISITNENSQVTSDRSIIQLIHYPATNVTRVFNATTGERYIVSNQNVDGTGSVNNTGRIRISGNTLPSSSDILQVDYNWILSYDQYSDYDGLLNTNNTRTVEDSVDWGYSNLVRKEKVLFTKDASNSFFLGNCTHNISAVNSASQISQATGTVSLITSGVYVNRLQVQVTNLPLAIETLQSVVVNNSNIECYATSANNGYFESIVDVVGIDLLYVGTVVLPTDTPAKVGDIVTLTYNSKDVFLGTNQSSFNNNQITIPIENINTNSTNILLDVSYIANINVLMSNSISSLPLKRSGNGFASSNSLFDNKFINNNFNKENQVIQVNGSNERVVSLSINSLDYALVAADVVSVVRLSDGAVLWADGYQGSVTTNNNVYQLILSGLNNPANSDRVLVLYQAKDLRRTQPFTFKTESLMLRSDSLQYDFFNQVYYVPLSIFSATNTLTFSIIEPTTQQVLQNITDGYLATVANSNQATLGSLSYSFSLINGLLNKKVRITNAQNLNNNGTFDIIGFNSTNNSLTISRSLNNISASQISVIRLLDNQEIWDTTGVLDIANNRINILPNSNINVNDKVVVHVFNAYNLKKTPTRLGITISDQTNNSGVITIIGDSLIKAENIVFNATAAGLQQSLIEATRKALGLASVTSIPSNIKIAKVIKVEKINSVSLNSDEVLNIIATYDVFNTKIKDNALYNENLQLSSLNNLDFVLPSTANNLGSAPILGDKLRATFYLTISNDVENIKFTRNGTLYTNKLFTHLNKIYVSSGFSNNQTARINIVSMNQPTTGSRYKIFYDYLAPKPNERIIIRYNYNRLISDVTFNIETNRPVNADVIVRQAKEIVVDVTVAIVVSSDFQTSSNIVLQNVKDRIIADITSNTLGEVLDSSDLVNSAYSISGVDRARIVYFNKSGELGQVLSLQAQKDEYFVSGTVIVNLETR